jgi:mono/diheme cytochrome c family protein
VRSHPLALALVLVTAFATAACGAQAPKGDAKHGSELFARNCASCHGDRGAGGIAPKLAGASITLDDARAKIDDGASGMPAGLVTGQDEDDVLAYLQQILAGRL